ncbi:hypothetical protein D3C75_973660 [compost metagenome]
MPAGQKPYICSMRALQKRMAQGAVVSRPHSSPLMKLAMRPNNRPIGATGAIRSPRLNGLIFWRLA